MLFVTGLQAGTISVSCNLGQLTSGFSSHGYATYTSIFGNLTNEPVSVEHMITNTDAYRLYNCTTPCSDNIASFAAGTPPNCYQAVITGTADDSSATASSNQVCFFGPPPPPPPMSSGTTCDGTTGSGDCGADTPIVLNMSDGPYETSGLGDPVLFDIKANGSRSEMTWTARHTPMAFLALDRDGNGAIDSGAELFGNHTPLPGGGVAANGYEALRAFDSNGDGVIDANDPVWSQLLLWIDANHDGVSQPDELQPISESGITAIELAYHWTGRLDANGNLFRYEGHVRLGRQRRSCYDIFFLVKP